MVLSPLSWGVNIGPIYTPNVTGPPPAGAAPRGGRAARRWAAGVTCRATRPASAPSCRGSDGARGEILLPPAQHRTRDVGLELLLDLPDEGEAPVPVQLLRLLVDQPVHLLVAIVGVVSRRPALVVLVEVHVRVVDAGRGQVGADGVVAARQRGEPRRG